MLIGNWELGIENCSLSLIAYSESPTGVENPCLIAEVLSKRTKINNFLAQNLESVLTEMLHHCQLLV
ncbi:hypothetical protein D0A37_20560 [Microcoleus vaginatus HSN003]|nr:hypothetical protein D0A37_20560 [Microcoleus vaginatus HSN003]